MPGFELFIIQLGYEVVWKNTHEYNGVVIEKEIILKKKDGNMDEIDWGAFQEVAKLSSCLVIPIQDKKLLKDKHIKVLLINESVFNEQYNELWSAIDDEIKTSYWVIQEDDEVSALSEKIKKVILQLMGINIVAQTLQNYHVDQQTSSQKKLHSAWLQYKEMALDICLEIGSSEKIPESTKMKSTMISNVYQVKQKV